MTVALGVCLLERSGNFDMTIENMKSDPETELLLVLSGHVARVIQDVIQAPGNRHCNQILGWGSPKHYPPQLISREDTKTLLILLWEDRTLFLEAFMSTYSPGLSGVMFLLWRYLHLERYVQFLQNGEQIIMTHYPLQIPQGTPQS